MEPKKKRKKLEEGSSSKIEEYSHSKTLIHFDNEDSLREKLKQVGGQDDVLIITSKIEEDILGEPTMPLLALTIEDFKGKYIDLIVE